MKILRIPLVIVLLVVAGRGFNANAQVTETNLHSFVGYPTDGAEPTGGLVQGSDGNFYGTTYAGGTYGGYLGGGTVFRISPSGSVTNLHSFVGPPTDGIAPYAGLVQGSDGNFYGTTYEGGANGGGTNVGGTVFRISPSGTYTNLHSFTGTNGDGVFPYAPLVQGSDGNFYGTTYRGGTNKAGTVFRISPSGTYTSLYSFGSYPADGGLPLAGLVQGSDGNFYGTTVNGGTNSDGTVFRISPSGSYSNLYSFGGPPTDGQNPRAGLVQGSDGNFYGTTVNGGTNCLYCGTVFRISPSGTYTNLYSFGSSPTDGFSPFAGLLQGSDGNFYGTTYGGGAGTNCYEGCGTVFKLTVPLSPPPYPINQITGVHLSGTNIVFKVVSIAGETYQLQFSSSMKPTNWVNVAGVSVTNSIGSILTLTNFAGANQPQGFYRFDITP